MITKINNFYHYNDKLIYVCDDFIVYDPVISKELHFENLDVVNKQKQFGTKVKGEEFRIDNYPYSAILVNFLTGGPLKSFKRIEILKNGRTIITYETGNRGLGFVYKDGNTFFVDEKNAYLIGDANAPKAAGSIDDLTNDYFNLFMFTQIVIPTIDECKIIENSLTKDVTYYKEEIEFLRQTDWTAEANFDGQQLHFSKTSIPGFERTPNGKFMKEKGKRVLEKIEIKINNETFSF